MANECLPALLDRFSRPRAHHDRRRLFPRGVAAAVAVTEHRPEDYRVLRQLAAHLPATVDASPRPIAARAQSAEHSLRLQAPPIPRRASNKHCNTPTFGSIGEGPAPHLPEPWPPP